MMKNLVIFDFSGTLSLGAVAFAKEETLLQAFQQSGLWRLGLRSSAIFWDEIATPSWEVGATTSIGYVQVLYDRLSSLLPAVPPEELRNCVSAFAGEYFRNSRLEAEWLPLLCNLVRNPETIVLVATDHYFEASRHILRCCESVELPAEILYAEERRQKSGKLYIANSAELGVVKADARFWQKVRERLPCEALELAIVIDDFGRNEASGDNYGTEDTVKKRHAATEAVLSASFNCSVKTFPFTLPIAAGHKEEQIREVFQELIQEAEYFIRENRR